MILSHNNSQVETNLENANKFKIAMNSKTFRMLSDTLYSDKRKAVIRELSCNAYDAQRAAGTLQTHKIKVDLPTTLSPIFKIRDYGIGMSEETVMSLYLTYGESTKDTSNDDIGCFGIGSKSPFAYTDLFTVTSYYGGTIKTYTVYLEEGIPNCIKVFEEETTEANGLEVQFNVDYSDIKSFEEAAKKVFKSFDILPEFNIELAIPETKYDIETDDYAIELSDYYYGNNNMKALQGNIEYPILEEMIEKLPFKFTNLLLKFNIGDFNFAPSREAISYDKLTIKNINDKLRLIEKQIIEEAKLNLEKCETIYEYTIMLKKYNSQLNLNLKVIEKYKLNKFKGELIDFKNYEHLAVINNEDFKILSPSINHNSSKPLTLKSKSSREKFENIVMSTEYTLLINDLNRKSGVAHLVNFYKDGGTSKTKFIIIHEDTIIAPIEKIFGKVQLLSEFISYDEEAIKAAKAAEAALRSVSKDTIFTTNSNSSIDNIDELDDNINYLYIPIVRRTSNRSMAITLLGSDFNTKHHRFSDLNHLVKDNYKIIFVKKSGLKKSFIAKKNVQPLDDYLKDNFNELFSYYIKYKEYYKAYIDITSNNLEKFFKNTNPVLKLDRGFSKYKSIIKYYNRFYKKRRYGSLYNLANSQIFKDIYDILKNNTKPLYISSDIKKDILSKYPMLKYITNHHSEDEEFRDYVKLILGEK